jgi:hypothetical protein
MGQALMIAGYLALAGAVVSGILGFLVYPARSRAKGKRHPKLSPQQGFARAMFIIFAAAAFVAFFFGFFMPG